MATTMTRTNMIDDDGSGTTGTVINNAWKQEFYGQIDTALAGVDAATHAVITDASTGAIGTWNLAITGNTTIIWGGTANATIDRLAVPTSGSGTVVRVINAAAGGQLFFRHYIAGGGGFLNWLTSGPTPLNSNGTATYVYDAAVGLWRLVQHEQGPWMDVPYSASNFTANGGATWTVTAGAVTANRYVVRGTTLTWTINLGGTTIGAAAAPNLMIAFPLGFTNNRNTYESAVRAAVFADAGGVVDVVVSPWGNGHNQALLQKVNSAAFAIGTVPQCLFTITCEVL